MEEGAAAQPGDHDDLPSTMDERCVSRGQAHATLNALGSPLRDARLQGRAEEAGMAVERLKRLKDLVDQLERLPASPDRDRVLAEVRSRAVDVDTGVTPRAMLPLREPTPPPFPPKPQPKRYRQGALTRAPSPARPVQPARPALARTATDDLGMLLWDDRLSLEDSPELAPLPHASKNPDGGVPPWALGLRG
jgi:hypothetical protein